MVDLSKRRKKISLSFFFFGEGKLSFRGRRRLSFFHFLEKIKDPFFSRSACSCQIPFFSLLFQRGFLQTWALFLQKARKGFHLRTTILFTAKLVSFTFHTRAVKEKRIVRRQPDPFQNTKFFFEDFSRTPPSILPCSQDKNAPPAEKFLRKCEKINFANRFKRIRRIRVA